MSPVSRQDVQTMLDNFRNQLLQRTPVKQDVLTINDTLKTLLNVCQQNQQLIRQAEYQRSQLTRRAIALETRIAQLEQEIHSYRDVLNRMAAAKTPAPQVQIVSQPQQGSEMAGQYVYRPV